MAKQKRNRAMTPMQEKFCQNIVSGMKPLEAYLSAYNWSGGKAGASVEAGKLMTNDKILRRIEELQEPIVRNMQIAEVNETQRIKDILWERIEICRENGDETAIARYTDQLNKLNGAYKDTPVDKKDEDNVRNLDTTDLLKLVGETS